ncbi:MAG: M6 family metalloprotease domain-containing protein [Sulfurimonas sp.]
MKNFLLLIIVFSLFFGCSSGGSSSSSDPVETPLPEIPPPVGKSSIPMLGILISYNNIQITSSQSTWSGKLFGKLDHQLNHYYIEASHGNFEFAKVVESGGTANDGLVSIRLDKNHPNADIEDFTTFAAAVYPDLTAALVALDSVVDFSLYDTNADGHITPDELLLTFIIAGYEDAFEGHHVTNGIWAHQYCMTSSSNVPTLDSVTLMGCANEGNFALFGERHGVTNSHDATIGIIAHELGHSAFHLPDLYNTQGTTGGIGYFGLMGAGTWARQNSSEYPGNTPTHFSAWSKYYNGWVTPKTVTGSTTLTQTASLDYDLIKIPIDTTSYYLLENRNNAGYDKGLYALDGTFGGGIAIWKVDETKLTSYYFDNNIVNADTANKGVDLVEAVVGTIDTLGGGGDENALYYEGNVNYFLTLVDGISPRASVMNLNIK